MNETQTAGTPPDTETADSVRAQAEQQRAQAEAARTEADTILTTARAQAARLIADAEARARHLTADAIEAERAAEPLARRAGYLRHAEQLRQQIADAEHDVVQLTTEQDQLHDTVLRLDARLAELGEERETTAAHLAAARERGDVDQVTDLRARLTGVEEVAAVVQGQLVTARQRLLEIGDPDGNGELNRAANAWQGLQDELRRIGNALDPNRPEALLDDIVVGLRAQVAIHQEQAKPAPARTTLFATR